MSRHLCHWPGCREGVPPRLWGCYAHWKALPAPIQRGILRAYVPGQEITKTPSAAYIAAAKAAQEWIRTKAIPVREAPAPFNEPKEQL